MSRPAPPDPSALRAAFSDCLDSDGLLTDSASRIAYAGDNSRRIALPWAVLRPDNPAAVQAVVQRCRERRWPLITRGSGSGTTGAAVAEGGGIVLSTERLATVLELNPADRLARVQPGLTHRELHQALEASGLFWPPDPTSRDIATVGGMLAHNSAGPKAVKYGVTRDWVLGLSVVDGRGELWHTGVRTTKGVVGYDLTRLMIGSEGTLGIVVEATLRLAPCPQARRVARAAFADVAAAARAVSALLNSTVTPSMCEFMDAAAIALVRAYAPDLLPAGAGAVLLLEVDGPAWTLEPQLAAMRAAIDGPGLLDWLEAGSEADAERVWAARKALSPSLKKVAPKKINEDVAVPVSRLPELVDGVAAIGQQYGITVVSFGHAGNGNLHVNLLLDPTDPDQQRAANPALDAVFTLVLGLGGTLSGEHGVGLAKRPYVDRELHPQALALMHGIKASFDPDGILNPGKTLPDLN